MDVGAGDGVGAEVGGTASGVQAIAAATKALSKMRAACSLIRFIGSPLCAARALWIPAGAGMAGLAVPRSCQDLLRRGVWLPSRSAGRGPH